MERKSDFAECLGNTNNLVIKKQFKLFRVKELEKKLQASVSMRITRRICQKAYLAPLWRG